MKLKIFIGPPDEGLEAARALDVQLERPGAVTVWSDGVFGLARGTLEALVFAGGWTESNKPPGSD